MTNPGKYWIDGYTLLQHYVFTMLQRSVDMFNIIIYAIDLISCPVPSFSNTLFIQKLLKNMMTMQKLVDCPAMPELYLPSTSFGEV